jgi:hypothetical protein
VVRYATLGVPLAIGVARASQTSLRSLRKLDCFGDGGCEAQPEARELATGGLMPSVDISDSAALQEMEDLEYVERMKNFK